MKLRKILAGVIASAVAASAMAFSAFADKDQEQGVLFLGFASSDWLATYWGDAPAIEGGIGAAHQTTAVLNGNGTYTVSVDLSGGYFVDGYVDEDTGDLMELTTANGIAAMGVHVFGEYPATLGADITSIKVDGNEIALSGTSFADTESDGRRFHIYNQWASYDSASDDHATSDSASATGMIIDAGDVGEWSKIEVTFNVYGLDDAAAPAADAAPAAGDVDAATDSSKGSPDTGVADVAVVAGLAIVAAGAVVVAKKRK